MGDQDEQDYHNFSQIQSSAAHRLPTLNGAEALLASVSRNKPISTSLPGLDVILQQLENGPGQQGGICCGRLAEVYGPPGSGKTQFAINLAVNALEANADSRVVWIDTTARVPIHRVRSLLQSHNDHLITGASSDVDANNATDAMQRFDHLPIRSLPHLIATIKDAPFEIVSENTCLLIIDGITDYVTSALPSSDSTHTSTKGSDSVGRMSKDDIIQRTLVQRRAAMLGGISAMLARLATSRNVAVIVLDRVSTTRRNGAKHAILKSTLDTQQWTENVSTRIVIYRDIWSGNAAGSEESDSVNQRSLRHRPLRFAKVERVAHRNVNTTGVGFVILDAGLVPSHNQLVSTSNALESVQAASRMSTPTKTTKQLMPSSPPNFNVLDEVAPEAAGDSNAQDITDKGLQVSGFEEGMPPPLQISTSPAHRSRKGELPKIIPDS